MEHLVVQVGQGAHGVKQQLVAVLAGDGHQPVAPPGVQRDLHHRPAVLGGPGAQAALSTAAHRMGGAAAPDGVLAQDAQMLCAPAVLMGGGAGMALCSTPTRPVGLEQAPDPAQPYGAGMPLGTAHWHPARGHVPGGWQGMLR